MSIGQFEMSVEKRIVCILLSACTQSQLDSLSLTTPRWGRTHKFKSCVVLLHVLKASGSNGSKNKKGF